MRAGCSAAAAGGIPSRRDLLDAAGWASIEQVAGEPRDVVPKFGIGAWGGPLRTDEHVHCLER